MKPEEAIRHYNALKEDYLNHLNSNNVPTVISKNKI